MISRHVGNGLLAGLALFFAVVVPTTSNADVIYEFGDSFTSAPTGLGSTNGIRDGIEFFENGDQTTNDLIFNDFSLTDSSTGTMFSFDITFSAVDSSGSALDVASAFGSINQSLGKSVGGGAPQVFDDGDVLSITVSDLQVVGDPTGTATAVFDGYVDIGTDNSGAGEGFVLDGTSFIRGTATTTGVGLFYGSDSDPRQGIQGADIDQNTTDPTLAPIYNSTFTTEAEFIGTASLRGVAFRFDTTPATAVPEPSSAALACAVGMFGLLRRRR